jgi:hypothetical protein
MGDLNDWDDKVLDVNDSKPKSRVLSILKGGLVSLRLRAVLRVWAVAAPGRRRCSSFVTVPCVPPTHDPGSDLRSVAELIPKAERYTDWYDRDKDCKVGVVVDGCVSRGYVCVSVDLFMIVTGAASVLVRRARSICECVCRGDWWLIDGVGVRVSLVRSKSPRTSP